ncbi:MAG: hypothetical protein A2V52_07885 [Actinobacteria bacterium RBG_19FT_COMBO_54_7]|uniref:SHOCT domain-containing protein n=1 Tax=Candidatus Solincola sediminis TaxID=1797199 RepID=A0A1F2WH59_9ACTN|nr:MAG: hypothetical protein A2Y75_03470 [Candidatus Solincola sediminis]OFW60488.1 MAG: hypothetical protein A2W01_09135 [Candidatus Solincola sediminis]OFW67474.1 MAG: hypothetical protein A2V52_07885 [Actinobacteria bacterium RBG_19FT_COMBO_54_7]
MAYMGHWGYGGWWMFGFGFLWFAVIAVVAYLLIRNYSVHGHGPVTYHGPTGPRSAESALDIAKRRFAAGEINREEFDSIVKGLKEADKTPPGAAG